MIERFAVALLAASVGTGGPYPAAILRALHATRVPVLLPAQLPSSLRGATPYLESVAERGYTMSWSFERDCKQPSCDEFSVSGGSDAIAPFGSVGVRFDGKGASYHAFACPLRCQPETLVFARNGIRYEIASKNVVGLAVLERIARSLHAVHATQRCPRLRR